MFRQEHFEIAFRADRKEARRERYVEEQKLGERKMKGFNGNKGKVG